MTISTSQNLAESLWRAYEKAGRECDGPVLIREVISIQQAEALERPWKTASDDFIVALADGPYLTRFDDPDKAKSANDHRGRTRLYESVHTRAGEWPAVVASHLAAWLGADVLSSVYEAEASDTGLPEHHDAWNNIVLQIEGAKSWIINGESEVVLSPGDVLVVPTGVMHYVRTPTYSVHINFEVVNSEVVAAYLRESTPVPPKYI